MDDVLQTWVDIPVHVSPPFAGAGLVQVRVCVAPFVVHVDGDHADQP
jgi:hypothetical protein